MTDDGRTRAARLLAQTPFAMPRAEALTHIEDRRRTLLTRPAPRPATADADFTAPEPMPVIDAPPTSRPSCPPRSHASVGRSATSKLATSGSGS